MQVFFLLCITLIFVVVIFSTGRPKDTYNKNDSKDTLSDNNKNDNDKNNTD